MSKKKRRGKFVPFAVANAWRASVRQMLGAAATSAKLLTKHGIYANKSDGFSLLATKIRRLRPDLCECTDREVIWAFAECEGGPPAATRKKFIALAPALPAPDWRRQPKKSRISIPFAVPKRPTFTNAAAERAAFYASDEWRSLRYQVLKERGGRCEACGASAKDGKRIHIDHVKPRSKFPELELVKSNLQVLCEDCNLGKSNVDATDWRPQLVVVK